MNLTSNMNLSDKNLPYRKDQPKNPSEQVQKRLANEKN